MGEDRPDEPWPVRESRTEWRTPYFEAGADDVEHPDGTEGTYYWIAPSDGVAVVAEDDGEVVMVEQYRPRLRARLLECPGGRVDDGESARDAAARELREETGYEPGRLELLGDCYQAIWIRATNTVAYATDLEYVGTDGEAGEFVEVRRVPVEEALDRVWAGETAIETAVALHLADRRGVLSSG